MGCCEGSSDVGSRVGNGVGDKKRYMENVTFWDFSSVSLSAKPDTLAARKQCVCVSLLY